MRRTARATAIVLGCLLFLLPLAFMVTGSLRMPGLAPPNGFEWLPNPLNFENYRTVFGLVPLWTYMLNSLFVVVIAVPVTVLVASWAGFAIATAAPPRQKLLVVISLVALMVPVSSLWIPRFVMFKWLGLIDTPWPLIAPALMATTPFYVLLFALSYSRISRSLYESAWLEGLSPFAVWRRVAFPLGRSVAFAVAVLAFIFHWSNFTDALLYLYSKESYTLPLGIRALQGLDPALHSLFLAGSVIVTIPAVIAFFLAQRAFLTETVDVT